MGIQIILHKIFLLYKTDADFNKKKKWEYTP